ncbi:CRAL-TRIO domain-containing protein [Actinidia chinensis var. chinensis]|uniref:CRAL-TRIO domain-containing protein n=1 Tax=Actinidia chinensis var. chinensis TaxID=1590841 RepID=A0A2R6PL92_ACTCC|nr:CRAL-TRIO domain-containing protein [Actinidia chinensis var. chinensis]
MGDSLRVIQSSKKLEPKGIATSRKLPPKDCVIASISKGFSQKTSKCISSTKQGLFRSADASDIALFIVKMAVLEIVRRYSRSKCPLVWHGLQALQFLCYPPLKWIQKWAPFKALIGFMQTLSKPLLVLTVSTVFSDQSACTTERLDSLHDPQGNSELQQEPSSQLSTSDTWSCDEVSESVSSEKWLQELHNELQKQGITLPERLNEDQLRRFYAAANGEFSRLLSSIKKTIRWRQTYNFLSPLELDAWSHLVFWHGYDMQQRPCLIIRLGLACSNLRSNNRSDFVKAVVSQIENGVMLLDESSNTQITVLMDCNGLSPFGFPMQMMRSCAMLLQDHYPNRLGYLIVFRLPPIARVITQTLFQVMRPTTQQKLRIIGGNYQKILSEYLQTLPSFLGGKCSCLKCSDQDDSHHTNNEIGGQSNGHLVNNQNVPSPTSYNLTNIPVNLNSDRGTGMLIGILVVWIFIALVLAKHYPDSFSLLYWQGGS